MPDVTMPDGTIVAMPDSLTPEQANRLRLLHPPKEQRELTPDEFGAIMSGMASPASASPLERRRRYQSGTGVFSPGVKASLIDSPASLAAEYLTPDEREAMKPEDLESAFSQFSAERAMGKPRNAAVAFLRKAVEKAGSPVVGLAQKAVNTFGSPSSAAAFNLGTRYSADLANSQVDTNYPTASTLGTIAGLAPYAAVMGQPQTMLGAAGQGAALGFTEPVTSPNVLSQTISNTGLGAGLGGATHGGVTALSKLIGAARGATTGWLPDEFANRQALIQDRLNIPAKNITAADLVSNKNGGLATLRNMSNMGSQNAENVGFAETGGKGINSFATNAFNQAPDTSMQRLQQLAASGDANAKRILDALPATPTNPAQYIQGDIQSGYLGAKQQYDPLFKAAEAIKPTNPQDVSRAIQAIDEQIANVKAWGSSADSGSIVKRLEQVKSDLLGSNAPITVAPPAPIQFPAGSEPIVKALKLAGKSDDEIGSALKNMGYKIPIQLLATNPVANIGTGTQPMNTLPGLEQLQKNLRSDVTAATKGAPNAITGSDKTHPLTEVIHALDEPIQAGEATSPAYVAKKQEALDLFKQLGLPHKESLVTKLVKSGGEAVRPSDAQGQLLGMAGDETGDLLKILSPKGKSAHDAMLFDNIFQDTLDNTKPKGYQFDRNAVLARINKLRPALEAGGDRPTLDLVNGMEEALQYMDQIGKGPIPNYIHGGKFNKALQVVGSGVFNPLLTTDTGKALLLTLSWARDPEMKKTVMGKIVQFMAKSAEKGGIITGGSYSENSGNPISYNQSE